MNELYEIIIYTASVEKYATPLMRQLDPLGYTSHHLFRNHCSILANALVKDLSLLGRDLSKVIIIDNSPSAYVLQPCNAIPIETWTGDKSDKALMSLVPVLEMLSTVDDVRMHIKKLYKQPEAVDKETQAKLLKYSTDLPQANTEQVNPIQKIKPRFIPLSIRFNKGNIKFPRPLYENANIFPNTNKNSTKLIPFVNNKPVTSEDLKLAATVDQQHSLEYRLDTGSIINKNNKKTPSIRFTNLTLYNEDKLLKGSSFKSQNFVPVLYNKLRFPKSPSKIEGMRTNTASKSKIEIRKHLGALITQSNARSPIYLTKNKSGVEKKSRHELALAYDQF